MNDREVFRFDILKKVEIIQNEALDFYTPDLIFCSGIIPDGVDPGI